jgi:hypothetical protein
LKPGGALLPNTVTAWIAPVWNEDLDLDITLRSGRPYDLDLSLVADPEVEETSWSYHTVAPETFAAPPQAMWTTDVHQVSLAAASAPFTASTTFTAAREGKFNALTTWFTAGFGNDITLTNAPTAPATHWGQYLFPLKEPVTINEGLPIGVEFACIPTGPGYSSFKWSVRVGDDGPWEHHDTRATQNS